MTYRHSMHIAAPVSKVFDFLADPNNWAQMVAEAVTVQDIHVTQEGLGTHYTWSGKIAGLPLEGFDVFTEFVPDRLYHGHVFERAGRHVDLSFRAGRIWNQVDDREPHALPLAGPPVGADPGSHGGEDPRPSIRTYEGALGALVVGAGIRAE